MIQIEKLSKSFSHKEILKQIDLQFERGQVYGIVGNNGAGKTTLFRCITGLEKYEGLIQCDRDSLKNHMGFLQTEPYFFPWITGEEYIQLLCNSRNIKLENLEKRNIFDLPLKEYAVNYSTGMKKKLAMTALLLQQNEYFILDEPYNGLDIQSNIIVSEIILKLKALQKVVIISSHIFSTLNEVCDRIYLLKDGEIERSIERKDFPQLEQEMKEMTIGSKIDDLALS